MKRPYKVKLELAGGNEYITVEGVVWAKDTGHALNMAMREVVNNIGRLAAVRYRIVGFDVKIANPLEAIKSLLGLGDVLV